MLLVNTSNDKQYEPAEDGNDILMFSFSENFRKMRFF